MVGAVAVALGGCGLSASEAAAKQDALVAAELNDDEQLQFEMTNAIRLDAGLEPVTFDPNIAAVIKGHLEVLCETGDFAHETPVAGGPGDRLLKAQVFFSAAGENLAEHVPDAERVTEGWMNSPPHRDNILGPWFKSSGIQHLPCPDPNGYPRHLWGQLFID